MAGQLPTLSELGIGRLFDVVPDAVVVGDVGSGLVVAWNEAAALTFGYDAGTAIGMRLDRLVPPELRAAHLAGLARYAAGAGGHLIGSRELVELPALHADGSQLRVELRLAAIDTGERRFVLAVFRDVTARRQAQDALAGAFTGVEEANAVLRDFVAMAAHDLRSPVAGIGMALELLARSGDDLSEPQRRAVVEGARRHTMFVQRLLDDLIDVSRIDAGQLAPEPAVLAVRPLLVEAAEIAAVEVSVDADADLHLVADRGHLLRVLANLIGNAGKYGRPPIEVSAAAAGTQVVVEVVDHGEGVAAELRERMFGKFVRGSGGAAGAGLGLAIVAGLVEANGGTVRYAPHAGGGSRFTTTWPRSGPPPQPR